MTKNSFLVGVTFKEIFNHLVAMLKTTIVITPVFDVISLDRVFHQLVKIGYFEHSW